MISPGNWTFPTAAQGSTKCEYAFREGLAPELAQLPLRAAVLVEVSHVARAGGAQTEEEFPGRVCQRRWETCADASPGVRTRIPTTPLFATSESEALSHSVVSDSLRPHGL